MSERGKGPSYSLAFPDGFMEEAVAATAKRLGISEEEAVQRACESYDDKVAARQRKVRLGPNEPECEIPSIPDTPPRTHH